MLGILSFFVNLLAFKRRWRVVVRDWSGHRSQNPSSNVLLRRDVPRKHAETTLNDLATDIEKGELDPAARE